MLYLHSVFGPQDVFWGKPSRFESMFKRSIDCNFFRHIDCQIPFRSDKQGTQNESRIMASTISNSMKNGMDDKRAMLQELLRNRAAESRAMYPRSHVQRSLWFMQQMHPQSATYNEALAWRIASTVDGGA